jgi:hypothetical protein
MNERMNELNNNKNLRATSLVEVLVVMGIIATTIVGSMVLVASSLVTVRNNQAEDYVNGLMINALEIIKSPSNVFVNDDTFIQGGTAPAYFKLTHNGTNAVLERTFDGSITDCNEQSQYLVTSTLATTGETRTSPTGEPGTPSNTTNDVPLGNPVVCLQVQINPQGDRVTYEVIIKSIYKIQNDTFTSTVRSQRYETFQRVQ